MVTTARPKTKRRPGRRRGAETPAQLRARVRKVIARLQQAYPDATCALHHASALELLVATILSAQSTDVGVNAVTPALFKRYPNARALAKAAHADVEPMIHATGFFRAKARSIVGMAQALVERHGGEVPQTRDALTALPGVGLKTANVILGNAFGQQAIAVDTHVFRVSQRLGLARSEDADAVHDQLVDTLPRKEWTLATHLLTTHGRRTCTARKPACPACPVRALCPWPDKTRSR